jgi:hypothetical protein
MVQTFIIDTYSLLILGVTVLLCSGNLVAIATNRFNAWLVWHAVMIIWLGLSALIIFCF